MSWKNVLRLYSVYSKAYRLSGQIKFRHYKEGWWRKYAGYTALIIIGLVFSIPVSLTAEAMWTDSSPDTHVSMQDTVASILAMLPPFGILYSLYFTQMRLVQRSGAKIQVQPIYWFPLTWEEHTMASIISTMMAPLAITVILIPVVVIPSTVVGMAPLSIFAILALLVGIMMTSATAEILKSLQLGIAESVSKLAGRWALWARFFATLAFFTIIYSGYYLMNRLNPMALAPSMARDLILGWFIPYLWPGIAVYEANGGGWMETIVFCIASMAFTWALYHVAVRYNARSALQDTITISISRRKYIPRPSLLERLGVSVAVSAIVRKDLKSYTRRQELMYVFITPIILVVSTIISLVTGINDGISDNWAGGQFAFMLLSLQPSTVLVIFLAGSVVGSEGERLQLLTGSPVSPQVFVRAKYLFCVFICGVVALFSVVV
ncbi:MAG TPA: hypothetical protein VK436_00290, partial [Methanocella sp.]|nr:hypothetical protein [Methanocella sp.]